MNSLVSIQMNEEMPAHFGFVIPGRPASPSDGRAQHYARSGIRRNQKIRTFNNGSTIVFGPGDITGDFKPGEAFYEQALMIQKARMDMLAAGAVLIGEGEVADGAMKDVDMASNTMSGILGAKDYLRAGEFGRRPKYSPSVHDESCVRGMNTWLGIGHPGLSVDTRFGVKQDLPPVGHVGVVHRPGFGAAVAGGAVASGVGPVASNVGPVVSNVGPVVSASAGPVLSAGVGPGFGGGVGGPGVGAAGGGRATKVPYHEYYARRHEPYLHQQRRGGGRGGRGGGHRGGHRSDMSGRVLDPDFYYGQ